MPMFHSLALTVTIQAELMKSRLECHAYVHTPYPSMATDAGTPARFVAEIVVTQQAIHRAVFLVRENRWQRTGARNQAGLQTRMRGSRQEKRGRQTDESDDRHDECGVATKRGTPDEMPGTGLRFSAFSLAD